MNEIEHQTDVKQTPRDKDLDMEFEESGVGKKFNYYLMIDLGLNRILALSAKQTTPENSMMMVNDLRRAISIYSYVLRPYYTTNYKQRRKDIVEEYIQAKNVLISRSRQMSDQAFAKEMSDIELALADGLMDVVTELLHDKNMLLKDRVALPEGSGIKDSEFQDSIIRKKATKQRKKDRKP